MNSSSIGTVAAKATTASTVPMPLECQAYDLIDQYQGGDLIKMFYKCIVAVDSILFYLY